MHTSEDSTAVTLRIAERIGARAADAMAMQLRRRKCPKVRFYLGRDYTDTERMDVREACRIATDSRSLFTRIELRWSGDVRIMLHVEHPSKGRARWSEDESRAIDLGMNPPGRTSRAIAIRAHRQRVSA